VGKENRNLEPRLSLSAKKRESLGPRLRAPCVLTLAGVGGGGVLYVSFGRRVPLGL